VIDRNGRLHVPGIPSVLVYPDDQIAGRLYSFPDCPRIALDDKQRPQMRLVLYGKQEDLQFQITGGLVTVTTSLGLYESERMRLSAALQARLKRENPGAVLTWAQMIWTKGQCHFSLTKDIHLTSNPSLFGDNSCVFHISLNEATARNLEQAWRNGLPGAYVRYELTAQTPPVQFLFEGKLNTASYDLSSLISHVTLE
jgi:hypothetical protein